MKNILSAIFAAVAVMLSACSYFSGGSGDAVGVTLENPKEQAMLKLEPKAKRFAKGSDKVLRWDKCMDGGVLVVSTPDPKKKNEPAKGYSFTIDRPATVYVTVDKTGVATLNGSWTRVDAEFKSEINSKVVTESVYMKDFESGKVDIPENNGNERGVYGMPNAAVVVPAGNPKPPKAGIIYDNSTGTRLDKATPYVARTSDFGVIWMIPPMLEGLDCVIPQYFDLAMDKEGKPKVAPVGYSFSVDRQVTVYLLVNSRDELKLPNLWKKTYMRTYWEEPSRGDTVGFDRVYEADFPAGKITIPANISTNYEKTAFALPHMAVIKAK